MVIYIVVHRKWDLSAYSNEFMGLFIENNERISILTSHLIIGYESLSLISKYLCENQCQIKSRLRFVQNIENKLNEKSFFTFVKSLSLFSCFYGIYPGEYTLLYLITYYLIYLYISILIISSNNQLIRLMNISGLHPIIYWISRFSFDFILTIIYSFFLYFYLFIK